MTTLVPRPPPGPGPSPSRINPFARPRPPLPTSNSFTRVTLLPTIPSPVKSVHPTGIVGAVENGGGVETDARMRTPAEKSGEANGVASTSKGIMDSGGAKRQAWRLLWRGGIELGKDGWRLEGVTFFALLTFPSTPSVQTSNPFENTPIQPMASGTRTGGGSPFALPSADTDLCLSLESMRGRKYLRIRGVVDLKEDEVLDGSEDGNVQMSISESSPLLAAYFTGLLCRTETLSSQGRTLSAIVIGLGDEAVDSPNSTVLVYGQLQAPDIGSSTSTVLRLCVGRRKPPPPPPSAKKVRPGEPLPRPPMFLPSKSSKPRPTLSKSRSLSRSTSSASIYAPPPQMTRIPEVERLPSAPISGRTPGRRGEKRPRNDATEDEERRRKNGRIVPVDLMPDTEAPDDVMVKEEPREPGPDEDIFGKRPPPKPVLEAGSDEPSSTGRAKRIRVPQQVLDNKAAIRKQTLVLLEARGIAREHENFKDVFSMATKGAYFAFRDCLVDNPIEKSQIQDIVGRHLDMYLPESQVSLH